MRSRGTSHSRLRYLAATRGGELYRTDGVKHELAQMSNALTA
jgi:hypothetical protein